MKIFKRNAVVIAVLMFVCVAVYLNWLYNKKEANSAASQASASDTADAAVEDTSAGESAGLYYTANSGDVSQAAATGDTAAVSDEVSQYFAQVRLTRQQARDEAKETLTLVTQTEGADEASVSQALESLNKIADWTVKEAELESLIIGKGFSDCVVYMTDDGVTVTVAVGVDGLSSTGAAQITDLVTGETDYTAANLKIIEIK